MKSYEVNITITSYGVATIEANNYWDALKLAQNLTAGDFHFVNGSDEKKEITQIEEQN